MSQFPRSRRWVATVIVAVAALATSIGTPVEAAGSNHPISGAVGWTCANWFTSSNLRFVSVGGSAVKVNLSGTGVGGVQFRVKNENTGGVSLTAFIPPLNSWTTLIGNWAGSTPFRNQFRCVNSDPNHGSTDFNGTEFY